jgi:branched-chain amino acid transport system substrate-binding protein
MPPAPRLIAAALLGLLLGACGAKKPQPVTVGLNLELTGDIRAVGTSGRNAAELFFEQLNAAGGVALSSGSVPVQLAVEDNAATVNQAAAAAQLLVSRHGAVAMIGPNSSSCAIAAAKIAETLKCVMISPWSSDPRTTLDESAGVPKRYVFRGCLADPVLARLLAGFAREKIGAGKAAVLHEAGDETVGEQARAFRDAFAAAGGEVVAFETYSGGVSDLAPQLGKIAAAAPDVVFLPALYIDVAPAIKQARAAGIQAVFLGNDAWSAPEEILRVGGADVGGSYFGSHFDRRVDTPEAKKFVADYTAKFGHPPDAVAALTYDACGLLVKALEKAGEAKRESVREALAQISGFRGATGEFTFEPGSGDPLKALPMMQFKDGEVRWIGTAGP